MIQGIMKNKTLRQILHFFHQKKEILYNAIIMTYDTYLMTIRVSKFVELSVVLSVMFFSTLNATLNSTINNNKSFYKDFVLSHLLLLLMCLACIFAKRSKKFGLNGHKVKRRP